MFRDAFTMLDRRIGLFLSLPLTTLEEMAVKTKSTGLVERRIMFRVFEQIVASRLRHQGHAGKGLGWGPKGSQSLELMKDLSSRENWHERHADNVPEVLQTFV